jgi:DNA-binding MarR family transcriptional regulator
VQTSSSTGTGARQGVGTDVPLALINIIRRTKSRAGERGDPATFMVLYHVTQEPTPRLSELAERCRLDHSTISRHVRALEDAGYLRRTGDPRDRRAYRLEATPTGLALLDGKLCAWAARIDEAIADWSDDDRRALTTLVTRLADALERAPAATNPEPGTES